MRLSNWSAMIDYLVKSESYVSIAGAMVIKVVKLFYNPREQQAFFYFDLWKKRRETCPLAGRQG